MSLIDLQLILQQQVDNSGSISVSKNTLDSANLVAAPNFDTTIETYLVLKQALSVAVTADIPTPINNQLTVNGTASFLGTTASTTVIFTLETNNVVDALIIGELPGDWAFSVSFPLLNNFPFNDFTFNQPNFLLTTAQTTNYTWNGEALVLALGLNFASNLMMGGPFKILQQLMNGLSSSDSILFTGTVDTHEIENLAVGTPILTLMGFINKSITANTHFNLSIPKIFLTSDTGVGGLQSYWLSFGTTLSVNGKPFSTFNAALIQDSPNLNLSMNATNNPITPDEIIQLIAGVDYTKSIPQSMDSIFQSVGLTGLYATINTNTMDILALSGSIGTTQPWSMGKFQIDSLTLNCQILSPFTSAQSELFVFSATAEIFPDIFKGEFDFEISYETSSKEIQISANYIGTVSLNDLIAGLSNNTIIIPKNFVDVEFEDFGMTFIENQGTYNYNLYGSAKSTFNINVLDGQVVANLEVNVDSATQNYVLIGGLTLGNSYFQISAQLSGGTQILSGSWTALNDDYLSINDILNALKLPVLDIPKNLDLNLKSATITYDLTNESFLIGAESANYGKTIFASVPVNSKQECFFLLEIDKSFSLSNLPLVGEELSKLENIQINQFKVIVGSVMANSTTAGLINQLIVESSLTGYPTMPDSGMDRLFSLSAVIDFGGYSLPLNTGTAKQTSSSSNNTNLIVNTTGNSSTIPPPSQSADGTTWFNIQKSFGPVNFQKIGVKYDNEKGVLWFLMNASLTAAGLEISLIGLGAGSPLSTFIPEFTIQGLGIDYTNSAVTIGGAFEKITPVAPVTSEYAGIATIQLEEFGISAVGAYAKLYDATSMFVFASVEGAFGGPGCFFITGFCGGFGYNSQLRIPGQNEVYQFPFVASMTNSNVLGPKPTPTQVMEKIMGGTNPWVTPSVGNIWLSAGIMFTTYEVVNSTALLVAEFGKDFLLSLIGLSHARFPMAGPEVYAYVELQLEAIFDPGDGVISFTAVLSPNSYLLDKNCHLTGGFAMEFWFGSNQNAGDFVLTLGGYSPYYNIPAHYPQEPRLGFNWAIDSSISITGGVYFALTPAAVMAGGNLNANYHSGNLKAWFTAYADIIIWYNPFHFIADIGVSVGASYKVDMLFSSKTFTVELGANLNLWGPETGGTITVHWLVISFTVNFGAEQSSGILEQTWDDFIKVLPAPDNVVKMVPLTGLLNGPIPSNDGNNQTTTDESEATPWVVRADTFEFTTQCPIPMTELFVGNSTTPHGGSLLDIKPMQKTALTSSQTISIIDMETGDNVLDDSWGITYLTSNVPSALWGTGLPTQLPSGDQLISDQLSGFQIKVPLPILGAGTGEINIKDNLQYDPLPGGKNPLQLGQSSQGPIPSQSDETIADIEQIMSTSIKQERDAIYNTFSLLGTNDLINGDLTGLATNAGALFVNEPLLTITQ